MTGFAETDEGYFSLRTMLDHPERADRQCSQEGAIVAAAMLWMSSVERDIVLQYAQGSHACSAWDATVIIARSMERTVQKLASVGLTFDEYITSYQGLMTGDNEVLHLISETALARLGETLKNPDTKAFHWDSRYGRYTHERQRIHEQIVLPPLENLRSARVPRFTIVFGPFSAGKSEQFRHRVVTDTNTLVIDPDAFRPELIDHFDPANHAHVRATNREVADVCDMQFSEAVKRGISLVSETSLRDLPWWMHAVTDLKGRGYTVDAYMVHRSLAECLQRTIAYRDRPAMIADYLALIERYRTFERFIDQAPVDNIYFTDMTGVGSIFEPVPCPLTRDTVERITANPRVVALD